VAEDGEVIGNNDVIIEIKGLHKVFQGENNTVEALRNINLKVRDQEFICLIGPSGSGKSTLLRLMEGLIFPTSGCIRVQGAEVKGPVDNAGFVFQEYSLMPWRTIIDNISFGLEIKGESKKDRYELSKRYLSRFGLEGFENNYPYELSGGMKQRAAIARAIVVSPKILFMDEPFGALDAYTRIQMQNDLIDFWMEEKRTVIFVTHSVEEAVFLGSRVLLMSPRPGEISKEYIIDNPYPRSRFDEKFRGHFQMIMEDMEKVSKHSN